MSSCLPAAFLGVGSSELLLVLAVALILLGPKELPRIARTIGRFMAHLRSVSEDVQDQVMHLDDGPPSRIGGEKAGRSLRDDKPKAIAAGSRPVATASVPADQNKDASHELAG